MSVTRLVPLTLGWQELDRSFALDGTPPGTSDRIPITGWLLETPEGSILFDTGYDPGADRGELAFPGYPPPDVIALSDAVEAAGYRLDDITDVVLSHLMVNHAGGLACLAPGTVVRADLTFLSNLEVRLVDGDVEPWPGIRLLSTPGHCPGHMSMLVELPDGWIALAADAADTQRNLTERIAPGILLTGREAALASIDRFTQVATTLGALMIPGHDAEVWSLLPRAFG